MVLLVVELEMLLVLVRVQLLELGLLWVRVLLFLLLVA